MTKQYHEPESDDLDLGQEKMNMGRFVAAYQTRRQSQAPTKINKLSEMQLPNNSVLHTLNGFDTLTAPNEGLPSPVNPLVANERFQVWLKIHSAVAGVESKPFGVKEAYIYRPAKLMPALTHFYQHNRRYHRILSDRTLGTMPGVLTWVDYSPLGELRVNGTMNVYRKFDVLFRTILDNVVKIGNQKNHYIVLPQSDKPVTRALLMRTFKELSNSTVKGLSHDPSIFPIIHLMGYAYGITRNLNVVPYKEDVTILGKDDASFAESRTTSLLERISPLDIDSINFILTHGDSAVVYNLGELARFSEDANFFVKFYRHVMHLRLSGAQIPSHIDADSDQFETLVTSYAGGDPDSEVADAPAPTLPTPVTSAADPEPVQKTVTKTERTETVKPVLQREEIKVESPEPVSNLAESIRLANTERESGAPLDAKGETKREQQIRTHLSATLGGKSLEAHIQDVPPVSIAPKAMDFVTSAPEASYKQSSLVAMDAAYMKHGYHHEMAKVLGSLGNHGLFIKNIEEVKLHTEMDRTTTYKVSLTDSAGKAHSVRYTLPDIDENGLMKLGGIEYRMTRQIVNVPICKISPTRVNLASNYNKVIVERPDSKRHSYQQDLFKLLHHLRGLGKVNLVSGGTSMPSRSVPYDYTAVGQSFTEVMFSGYHFYFGPNGAPKGELNFDQQEVLECLSKKYGTSVGRVESGNGDGNLLFWDMANQIHEVNQGGKLVSSWRSFNHLLVDQLGADAILDKPTTEWTQANLINQKIPLIFILGYKFGLKAVLDMINLDYRFYPAGARIEVDTADIAIRFADGTLVFNRYPLSRSLIAGGLAWVNLKDVSFRDLSLPDTYGYVFQKKKMTVGVLKGLSGFFDFFVDPITKSILEKMKEPTTFHELLLRANVMLSDYVAPEGTSVGIHRFRMYERFNGIIYNEIFRALNNHRGNPNTKKSFSINPEAVFLKIVQDETISPNDVINPVHELKQKANFTFTGGGGRTKQSMEQREERVYPKDGLGVISDAVPDSGSVGVTAYLSASPNIDDLHGIPKPYKKGDVLEPTQILSPGAMLLPAATSDDGKRASYASIQISHYVPNHGDGETLSVRTGYDEVLPHLSSDTFASAASDDGVVESIDPKHKVIKVRYKDTAVQVLGTKKLPYLDTVLNSYRLQGTAFGVLVPETELDQYPIGGVFNLTKQTNGKVTDRLRCETVAAVPDKEAVRKQPNLVHDLTRGRYKALYYIRFVPTSVMTPGVVKSYSFDDIYSPISGAYLLQTRVPNVKEGETFKRGDILVYNPGFYVPDPMSKQVTFKHGVTASIALMDQGANHEDACVISKSFGERLKMTPCHQREIATKNDAAILDIVKVGQHVETTDPLCIISDDYLIQSSLKGGIENLDIMEKLNRQTPHADYTGTIKQIRVLYSCERESLSESLLGLLKVYEKQTRDQSKAQGKLVPQKPGWIAPGTKYKGIDFDETTVVLEFMIEEVLGMAEGDKLVISNAAKSVVSHVNEEPHYTESGIPIDLVFSTTSITNRIIMSPMVVGMGERNMEKLKDNVLDMYFGENP